MLLPWLVPYVAPAASDEVTTYYPTESEQTGDEYVIPGSGSRYEYRAQVSDPEIGYRVQPPRR